MRLADPKQFVSIFISLAITAACLFVAAGRMDWPHAWVLLALSFLTGLAFTAGRDPDLAAERRNVKAGKSSDKVLVGISVVLGPTAMWITAGLQCRFRGPSEYYSLPFFAGVVAGGLSAVLAAAAMRANRFFSAVVRIQSNRGHRVVDHGRYRVIRHPGYAGMIVFTLATPLILSSSWAFVPAIATAAATVVRTLLEEATLCRELEGYADYARRVRFRFVLGVR